MNYCRLGAISRISQFRLQADSVAFFTSGKAEDVNSTYKYLAFAVVQVPCSTARSLCSHHLSFHYHPIIYSEIEFPFTVSLNFTCEFLAK
jgi:hypothetical protein